MYNDIAAENILFFDIETAPAFATFADADADTQHLWQQKTDKQHAGEPYDLEESYLQAGLSAEFGRVVCISCGIITRNANGQREITTTSYCSGNERELLDGFRKMLNAFTMGSYNRRRLCGHNIREFDVPFIGRRMLIHGLPLSPALNVIGVKPWDSPLIDTMEIWKFGKRTDNVALKTLCHVFGHPTPKDDIDGSQVGRVFHQEKDLQRIATYCEKDVVATARVFLSMRGEEPIENVKHKEPKTE